MKITRKRWNIIIDAALAAGFAMAFFVDRTGLSLHQWLGLLLLFLVGYHVMLHLAWCKAAAGRAPWKMPFRMRIYCLVDVGLLISFMVSLVTGLIISTWLGAGLLNYPFWCDLHVDSSYATLVLTLVKLVVKMGFHRRRVKGRVRECLGRYVGMETVRPTVRDLPAWRSSPAQAGALMTRRRILSAIAITGIAVLLPPHGVWFRKDLLEASRPKGQDRPQAPPPEMPLQGDLRAIPEPPSPAVRREPPGSVAPAGKATLNESPTSPIPEESSSAPPSHLLEVAHAERDVVNESACSIRCSQQCIWPERGCRRYVDANGNGKCDLGECL